MGRVEFSHELVEREVGPIVLGTFILFVFALVCCLLGQVFFNFGLELSLSFGHGAIEFLFTLVGLVNGNFAGVFELFDVVSALDDIFAAKFYGKRAPLPQFEHGLRVALELLFLDVKVLLKESHLFVGAEITSL